MSSALSHPGDPTGKRVLARVARSRAVLNSPRMKADRDLVRRFGVLRAPAYTINGRLYMGWGTWELFRGGVDEERRQMAALLKSGKKLPEALRLRAAQNVPKSADALPAYAALVGHLHTGLTGNAKKKG